MKKKHKYELVKFMGKYALYFSKCLDADTEEDLYIYNFRLDSDGQFETLEKRVGINGGGALLYPAKIAEVEEKGYIYLYRENEPIFLNKRITLKEFKELYKYATF